MGGIYVCLLFVYYNLKYFLLNYYDFFKEAKDWVGGFEGGEMVLREW